MMPETQTAPQPIVGLEAARRIPIRSEVKPGHKALLSIVQHQIPVKITQPTTLLQANTRR